MRVSSCLFASAAATLARGKDDVRKDDDCATRLALCAWSVGVHWWSFATFFLPCLLGSLWRSSEFRLANAAPCAGQSCAQIRVDFQSLQSQIDSGSVRVDQAATVSRRYDQVRRQFTECQSRCASARTRLEALEARVQSGGVRVDDAERNLRIIEQTRAFVARCDLSPPRESFEQRCADARKRKAAMQERFDSGSVRVDEADRYTRIMESVDRFLSSCTAPSRTLPSRCADARRRRAAIARQPSSTRNQAVFRQLEQFLSSSCGAVDESMPARCEDARNRRNALQARVEAGAVRVEEAERIAAIMGAQERFIRTSW